MMVPNITNICYGRGVGYKIEEIELSKEIQEISATKIRAKMREGQLFYSIHLFQIMKLGNQGYTEKDYVVDPYLVPKKEFQLEFFCGEQEQ